MGQNCSTLSVKKAAMWLVFVVIGSPGAEPDRRGSRAGKLRCGIVVRCAARGSVLVLFCWDWVYGLGAKIIYAWCFAGSGLW